MDLKSSTSLFQPTVCPPLRLAFSHASAFHNVRIATEAFGDVLVSAWMYNSKTQSK